MPVLKGDKRCPNFLVCRKMYDPRLKVCGPCFWRFNNEILEFKNDKCPVCFETTDCVKFRKCSHFVCVKCYDKLDKCPMCRQDPEEFDKLKKVSININEG